MYRFPANVTPPLARLSGLSKPWINLATSSLVTCKWRQERFVSEWFIGSMKPSGREFSLGTNRFKCFQFKCPSTGRHPLRLWSKIIHALFGKGKWKIHSRPTPNAVLTLFIFFRNGKILLSHQTINIIATSQRSNCFTFENVRRFHTDEMKRWFVFPFSFRFFVVRRRLFRYKEPQNMVPDDLHQVHQFKWSPSQVYTENQTQANRTTANHNDNNDKTDEKGNNFQQISSTGNVVVIRHGTKFPKKKNKKKLFTTNDRIANKSRSRTVEMETVRKKRTNKTAFGQDEEEAESVFW